MNTPTPSQSESPDPSGGAEPSRSKDTLTYATYLMVPELLSLQQHLSIDEDTGKPEHDETLFIIIHQVYELWFKQILHEIDHVVALLRAGKLNAGRHHLRRVLTIMKTLVGQIDVLETMTPAEFASFRSFLANASGFQSAQFRNSVWASQLRSPTAMCDSQSSRTRSFSH